MLLAPLEPLGRYAQFVAWRIELRPNKLGVMVPTKVPYSPVTGGRADNTNPAHWTTYEAAAAFAAAHGMDGEGFVFTEQDPFFFLDIDKCLQPDNTWSIVAQELCARFTGAMIEVSHSGTGLHVVGSCTKGFDHKSRNAPLKLEFYTKERFMALGSNAIGSVLANMNPVLPGVVSQFFTRDIDDRMADEWTTAPRPGWAGPEDDTDLLDRIFRSDERKVTAGAAFGAATDIKFVDLFTANADVLGVKWPDPVQGRGFDYTYAEQSIANQLAFWTGGNCERIERIMRISALCRPKWDTHPTYLQTTILKAVGLVTNNYAERVQAVPAPPIGEGDPDEPPVRGGYMLRNAQLQHFAGCVYITALNKVLTPDGGLLDQPRFNVLYGGSEFVLSPDGRKTTTSAWTAFTESQTDKPEMADRLCFRPEHGAGGIIMDSGKRLANTYIPAQADEVEGDPAPFINHIHKMLPHGRDAEMLLTYMASVKQNPGMKAQWWPVVQGAEGNFKTFLLTIMDHAVGTHYSHRPNMAKMIRNGSNFNGWVERKLFLGLDEVYGAHRREFFEDFKTTVTNRSIPIEGKGLEEITGDNRANGMIVTNHQDGVPVIGKNRRYTAFFCAQQTPEDMLRDGMDARYIANLKDWLLGQGVHAAGGANYGIRVVVHYLARKPLVAELDPAQLAIRPLETTSTQAAMVAGRGRLEQEIIEAIDEERPGFAGGWVSSIYLDRLIKEGKFNLAYSKRREVMQSIGYDWHPALIDGRVNNPCGPEHGKPRLFIKNGHLALNMREGATIAKAYSDAQLKVSGERSAAGQAFGK